MKSISINLIILLRGTNSELKPEGDEINIKKVFMKLFSKKEEEIKWYTLVYTAV